MINRPRDDESRGLLMAYTRDTAPDLDPLYFCSVILQNDAEQSSCTLPTKRHVTTTPTTSTATSAAKGFHRAGHLFSKRGSPSCIAARRTVPANSVPSSERIHTGEREQLTMNKRRLYRAGLLLGTVGLLITGVCGLWLRSYRRQEALNRQLIAALVKGDRWRWRQETSYDYQEALSLVNAGADPNTPLNPLPAPSLRQPWNYVIHRSPLPVNHSPSAFLIACGAWWTENDDRKLHEVPGENPVPLIQAMFRHGANAEARGEDGWTPLIYAVCQGNRETLDVLLAHGVNANAKAEDGESPLYWAMYGSVSNVSSKDIDGTSDTVLALLAHGADPNLPDRGGTLLQFAAERPYLVAILRRAGAKK
jgi:hypothetical protein